MWSAPLIGPIAIVWTLDRVVGVYHQKWEQNKQNMAIGVKQVKHVNFKEKSIQDNVCKRKESMSSGSLGSYPNIYITLNFNYRVKVVIWKHFYITSKALGFGWKMVGWSLLIWGSRSNSGLETTTDRIQAWTRDFALTLLRNCLYNVKLIV